MPATNPSTHTTEPNDRRGRGSRLALLPRPMLRCSNDECDFSTHDSLEWQLHEMDTGHTAASWDDEPVEICAHCGETRVRILFYQASCTPANEYDGEIPGPPGEHAYVWTTRGAIEREEV